MTEGYRSCLSKRGAGGLTLTDGQRQAFAGVEKDRDGRITYDEFMRVVGAHRGPGQRMSQTGRTQ